MVQPIFVIPLLICAIEAVLCFKVPVNKPLSNVGRSHRTHATSEGGLLNIETQNVEKILDLVRPQLAAEGGKVSLTGINDHEILIKLDGNCKSCPYRLDTVKNVIEATLVRFLKCKGGKQITVKVVEDK
ncbi:nifU chloroplastic-like [Babesia ovis]|uniref:NifU chloroplastic-like n=1 Tax=Babesia ovis TaxID=5869 RepID=A0A9W5WVT5_BABOV|nr:nifU chloroplastic-like [Babesia ovis]